MHWMLRNTGTECKLIGNSDIERKPKHAFDIKESIHRAQAQACTGCKGTHAPNASASMQSMIGDTGVEQKYKQVAVKTEDDTRMQHTKRQDEEECYASEY